MVRGKLVGFYQAFSTGGKKYRFDPNSAKERTRALELATARERELKEREKERRNRKRRSKRK